MKNSLFRLCLLVLIVLVVSCSKLPTTLISSDKPGVYMKQDGQLVDSLLVNQWATFLVNTVSDTPVAYQWIFGDGKIITTDLPQVEYRYLTIGQFTLTVKVSCLNGSQETYRKNIAVYNLPVDPNSDILTLVSSTNEGSGRWTYRLGLLVSAYSNGSGNNPFVSGEPGGVVITNPTLTHSWVQLVNQQENGRLIINITCPNQTKVVLNYGGNFQANQEPQFWNWANTENSNYYVAETSGGNLQFSLRNGQIFQVN